MDAAGWPEDHHRHKRSHAEMSQATLSPSPMIFRRSPSNFSLPRYSSVAPANNDLFLERRRTSHPHNSQTHSFLTNADNMPQRSQSQQRPRLEHRASQTVIDLTEDVEDPPPRIRAPPQPPQLGRSDAQNLAQIIDLTEDEVEVQITGARNRELPLPRLNIARPMPSFARPPSPDLFVQQNLPPPFQHADFPAAGGFGVAVVGDRHGFLRQLIQRPADAFHHIMGHAHAQAHIQAMPNMDYRHPAFVDRKPDHVAPPPAKTGFTRSPLETDTVICPSCDEELVHNKEVEEPVAKKGGKAPTKKEREEHPFWVIRECGHVYCNHCYQNRAGMEPSRASFPEGNSNGRTSKKTRLCAVEDCQSDVKDKGKWVGVFL